jgi:succinate dehydrogenase / fumarate reductase cytochrome b subunit
LVAGFYVVAMTLLFLHLSHGVGAMFQSLGWKNPAYAPLIARFAVGVSWLIYLGYIAIPVSILVFGVGRDYVEALK